jgi:hypothetical protein
MTECTERWERTDRVGRAEGRDVMREVGSA